MKLSQCILDNMEPILLEWDSVARTIFPKSQQTTAHELRAYAKQIILNIVYDLNLLNCRSYKKYSIKQGVIRLKQGFTINDIAFEYKSLRQNIIKIFSVKSSKMTFEEIIQFNKSLDQSLSEAVKAYSSVKEKQNYLFDTMLSSSPDFHYILDLDGSFLYINKAMANLYHKPLHTIIGKKKYNFAMPDATIIKEHIAYIMHTGQECHGEVHVKKSSKTPEYFFEYVYAPVFDKNNQIIAIAGTARDISKQKAAEAQIWYNANYDYLTGLANRRRFSDKLEYAVQDSIRTKTSYALFFIDLDKFKIINDQFGHNVGDICLKIISSRIEKYLRKTDLVARVGGDEFTIIITSHPTQEEIEIIARKLLLEIKKSIYIKNTKINITASIGITLITPQQHDADVLLINADQAMYNAKKLGGNRYCFYQKSTLT